MAKGYWGLLLPPVIAAVLSSCWICGIAADLSSERPNVLILFADDLGYGDLSCYGHPTSSTPNLDKLASEGMVFTQFYCAAAVCSPSRAALMTGRYHVRSGIYPGVLYADSIGGLPHNETTIAEMVKSVGYSTAHIGKWHLGVGENYQYLPTTQGFDYYLGIPYSHDMCPCPTCFYPDVACTGAGPRVPCHPEFVDCPLFENGKIVQQPADFLTLTQDYVSAASFFIEQNANSKTPFFLYFAFQHTHTPQFASEQFTNTTLRGPFGDSLANLDWGVGEVITALEKSGVANNTFVFFTSDNGPALNSMQFAGSAGLLRCGKGTTWEGGMREPAIAWWPGRIKPGKTHELAATLDLFPTVAKLTGATMPTNVTLDGVDMSPFLFGNSTSDRDYFVYFTPDPEHWRGPAAVRWKQYKAHYHSTGAHCSHTYPDEVCRSNYSLHTYDPPLLYNLNSDPSEVYNLDVNKYSDVLSIIDKVKQIYQYSVTFGISQTQRGKSDAVEACAKPDCIPFPSCCTTNTNSSHWKTLYSP